MNREFLTICLLFRYVNSARPYPEYSIPKLNSSSIVAPDNPKLVLENVDLDQIIEIPDTTHHQLIFYDPYEHVPDAD